MKILEDRHNSAVKECLRAPVRWHIPFLKDELDNTNPFSTALAPYKFSYDRSLLRKDSGSALNWFFSLLIIVLFIFPKLLKLKSSSYKGKVIDDLKILMEGDFKPTEDQKKFLQGYVFSLSEGYLIYEKILNPILNFFTVVFASSFVAPYSIGSVFHNYGKYVITEELEWYVLRP